MKIKQAWFDDCIRDFVKTRNQDEIKYTTRCYVKTLCQKAFEMGADERK